MSPNLKLADPKFHCPDPSNWLRSNIGVPRYRTTRSISSELLGLFSTRCGWDGSSAKATAAIRVTHKTFVTTFWSSLMIVTPKEILGNERKTHRAVCENHFAQHTQRDNAACYIIALLRRNISLGNHEDVPCIDFSRSNENWYAIQNCVTNTLVVIYEYDHKKVLCIWAYDIYRSDRRTRFLPFHIFLDDRGILRVGGRLWDLNLPNVQSHPILMPKGLYVIRPCHSGCVHCVWSRLPRLFLS